MALQSEKVFPPMPAQAPPGWTGSSIVWVGKNALLIYGQVVIDATTGDQAGDSGIASVTSQNVVGRDVLQLGFKDPQTGQQRLAVVRLNADKIDELTKPKK